LYNVQDITLLLMTFLAGNSKAFSSFSPARGYHPAAIWCRHALTESVLVSTFSL
jgi:hypothetical protein